MIVLKISTTILLVVFIAIWLFCTFTVIKDIYHTKVYDDEDILIWGAALAIFLSLIGICSGLLIIMYA